MAEAYLDKHGVAFADYRKLLPKRSCDFPPANVVRDGWAIKDYHATWKTCQLCGANAAERIMELHHIVGASGRSDERANLILLCREHHAEYGPHSDANFGTILWAKHHSDPHNTDWIRLAILARRFLPDLVINENLRRQYNQRIFRLPPGPAGFLV